MNAEIIDLLEKIVVPIVTALIGLFGGIHLERSKNKNSAKINGNGNNVNQGNSININQEVKK
ncbi:MAG: hypothetical protein MJ147_04995 [Clostridia bacterium]|nr:hypothetical protein [Clostridia bacterium]